MTNSPNPVAEGSTDSHVHCMDSEFDGRAVCGAEEALGWYPSGMALEVERKQPRGSCGDAEGYNQESVSSGILFAPSGP